MVKSHEHEKDWYSDIASHEISDLEWTQKCSKAIEEEEEKAAARRECRSRPLQVRSVWVIRSSSIEKDSRIVRVHDHRIVGLSFHCAGFEEQEADADAHVDDHHACRAEICKTAEDLRRFWL